MGTGSFMGEKISYINIPLNKICPPEGFGGLFYLTPALPQFSHSFTVDKNPAKLHFPARFGKKPCAGGR